MSDEPAGRARLWPDFSAAAQVHSMLAFGSIGLLVLTVLAFWPTYLSKPLGQADAFTHLHAIVGALWLMLLLAQSFLLRIGKRGLHKRLGRVSYAVAPLFVMSAVLLAHYRFSRMDAPTFHREAHTLYLPLSAALLFAAAYGLALAYRKRMQLHSRFMACTGILLIDPVLGRALAFHVLELPQFWHYQVITFGIECVLVLALLRSLSATSPDRHVFAGFAAAFVTVQLAWFALPETPAWLAFAQWFRHWPIT